MSENPVDPSPQRSRLRYWKMPVLFGLGFCVLQVLLALVRFGFMVFMDPANLLVAIPNILSGLALFFLSGLLAGLLAQRLLRGVVGSWRSVLLVTFALATLPAIWFSLAGGLLGPHGVVIGAVVPYLILVGIPVLIRKFWERFRGYA